MGGRRAAAAWCAGGALLAAAGCTQAKAGHGVAIIGPPASAASQTGDTPTSDPPSSASPSSTPTTASPTPTKKPASNVGTCPGAKTKTTTHVLRTVMLAKSPDKVPLNKDSSGPQSLSVLVHQTYKGVKGASSFLMNIGYRDGYQRTWSKGPAGKPGRLTEFATLYAFADTKASCAFAAWETKNYGLKPTTGLPGLTADTSKISNATAYSTEFAVVKGRYVILGGALIYSKKNASHASRLIVTQQYARV